MGKKLIPTKFLGDSREIIRSWDNEVKALVGYEIMRLQNGDLPMHWKTLPGFPMGTREIRVKADTNIYRTIYVIEKQGTIYIVHAFQKKSQKISKQEAELIRQRLKDLR